MPIAPYSWCPRSCKPDAHLPALFALLRGAAATRSGYPNISFGNRVAQFASLTELLICFANPVKPLLRRLASLARITPLDPLHRTGFMPIHLAHPARECVIRAAAKFLTIAHHGVRPLLFCVRSYASAKQSKASHRRAVTRVSLPSFARVIASAGE